MTHEVGTACPALHLPGADETPWTHERDCTLGGGGGGVREGMARVGSAHGQRVNVLLQDIVLRLMLGGMGGLLY